MPFLTLRGHKNVSSIYEFFVEKAPSVPPGVGDGWSWGRLQAVCLRETRRILRSREDAEEAAQEALLRVWRQRDQCRESGAPDAWVAQIARREALRCLQRNRLSGARTVAGGDILPWLPDERQDERTSLEALRFRETVAVLNPGDRALATLHYRGDLDQGTIARALGLPEATVRVRLHRLRARLKGASHDERDHRD